MAGIAGANYTNEASLKDTHTLITVDSDEVKLAAIVYSVRRVGEYSRNPSPDLVLIPPPVRSSGLQCTTEGYQRGRGGRSRRFARFGHIPFGSI